MKIICLISLFVFTSQISFSQDLKDEINQILTNYYGNSVEINLVKFELPSNLKKEIERTVQQKFYSSAVYLYKVKKNKKDKAYAILDNVYGKSMPITFIVFFNEAGVIENSEIVKYREQYGGAVKNKNWNQQFNGRNSESSYVVGKDINSISGATISVNSVTKGVQKLTILISEIIKNE